MDRAALLADFQAKVEDFSKYQGFIEKTRAQASKFAPAVVEKVLKTNLQKRDEVVAELIPLTSDLDDIVAELTEQRQGIESGREGSKLQMQELELRLAIDELSDEDFEKQSKELRDVLSTGDEKIAEIDRQLAQFRDAITGWRTIGEEAGVLSDRPAPPPAPLPAAKPPPPRVETDHLVDFDDEDAEQDAAVAEDDDDSDEAAADEPEISVEDDEEAETFQTVHQGGDDRIRFEEVHQADDVSVVFADEEDSEGIKLEVGDMDTLVDDDLQAVEEADEDRPRRAVMLYQEGTAEEQVYPFTGDVMTLGRGRDNDIQVKNDSKVSRYHCKLYRRNGNFYIEDNKSANGTLVNGELVTERRLFGGEEIIIGETFFRFRIMD